MILTNDGVASEIVSPGAGKQNRVEAREPGDASVSSSGAGSGMAGHGMVDLSSAELVALTDGPALARSHRIARLTHVKFRIVFGDCNSPRYPNAIELRRIGGRLTDPTVTEALRDEPIRFLRVAARETDPAAQIRAAVQARIDEKNKQAERKARR